MLFSLATLRGVAPPPKPAVTESSALIDIGALLATRSSESARVIVSPLAPPVTFSPPADEALARRGRGPLVIGATALAVAVMVTAAVLVGVRAKPSPVARTAAAAVAPSPALPTPTPTPTSTSTSTPTSTPTSTSTPTPTPTPTPKPARITTTAKRTATTSAPTATAPSTRTAPKAPAKCCAGESELACQMRLATGATCAGETPRSR